VGRYYGCSNWILSMQEQLLNLYNLVRYELEEYNQLLELLYQERQVLVERKIGDLADLISEKEKLIYSSLLITV